MEDQDGLEGYSLVEACRTTSGLAWHLAIALGAGALFGVLVSLDPMGAFVDYATGWQDL